MTDEGIKRTIKQKVEGYPYCDFHVRRASQPTKPRAVAYPHFIG